MGYGIASDNRGAKRPLGIVTGNYVTPPSLEFHQGDLVDSSTGEILTRTPQVARAERWALKSVASKLLSGDRVSKCMVLRAPLPGQGLAPIEVHKGSSNGKAFYHGLMACGLPWVCPVCAAKISERRKQELLADIAQHEASGGQVALLTITTPHYLFESLKTVLERQALALKYFNKGSDVTRFNKSIGYIGSVRALEVTHGRKRQKNHGWHPHYHILLFIDSGHDLGVLRAKYFSRWFRACEKAKMPTLPDFEHGTRLEDGSKAAAYASKWGLESEMTKGHIKKANNGETPFDFLRAYAFDDDKQAAALFREFAETFKGKRQLHWSHGLKARFDLEEKTDDELAADQDDQASILGTIELDDWKRILKADVRGEILELARHGWEPVDRFLTDLRKQL